MAKVFGTAVYSAHRSGGVLHITATGQKPNLQTKVTIEELPFLIWPPEFGLFFDNEGIVSPVVMPFEIERAFSAYPASRNVVAIRDATGMHTIDIHEEPAPVAHPATTVSDGADYVVYRQVGFDRYLVAKADQIVPAIYTKVFGPDTLAKCQQYVKAHTPSPHVDLVAGTLHAWVNHMPGPGAHPKLIVTVDAFIGIGWTVKIVKAEPQGINPAILLLKLDVEPPAGPIVSHAIIRRTLRFEDTQTSYTSVTVENGSTSMSAPVAQVE